MNKTWTSFTFKEKITYWLIGIGLLLWALPGFLQFWNTAGDIGRKSFLALIIPSFLLMLFSRQIKVRNPKLFKKLTGLTPEQSDQMDIPSLFKDFWKHYLFVTMLCALVVIIGVVITLWQQNIF